MTDERWGDPFGVPTFVPPDEDALLAVLDHPLRTEILSHVTARPMTPREVSREIGRTREETLYHLQMLDAAGYVEIVEPQDGGEPRYRYCEHWSCRRAVRRRRAGLPEDLTHEEEVALQRALLRTLARATDRRIAEDLPEGAQVWLAELGTWLPRGRWEEALALVRRATALVHEHALPGPEPGAVRAGFAVCLLPWWLTDDERAEVRAWREAIEAQPEAQEPTRADGTTAPGDAAR